MHPKSNCKTGLPQWLITHSKSFNLKNPPEGNRRKRGSQSQAIGRSRGGLATKIVALVDALSNLVKFQLLPVQAHDIKGVAPLIKGVSFNALLTDKAFDADWLLQADPSKNGKITMGRRKNGTGTWFSCSSDSCDRGV